MFRRKEDSLFDDTTDPNQESAQAEGQGNNNEASKPSSNSPSSQGSSNNSGANNVSSSSNSNYGQSAPRPPANTQNSAGSSSNFRPGSAPIASDMGRNRMPDSASANKPQAPGMPSPSGPIPSPSSSAGEAKQGSKSSSHRVLTVGNDILLKGEIATCDRLVIEGKVDATLNDVHTVEIAEHGSFKGSASIEDAEISGLFEGDLIVRNRLVIYGTGKVRGNISYGEIEIQRGGELTGDIKSNSTSGSSAVRARGSKSKEAA